MQRMFLKILAIALLMLPVAYAQSLGDVARELVPQVTPVPAEDLVATVAGKRDHDVFPG